MKYVIHSVREPILLNYHIYWHFWECIFFSSSFSHFSFVNIKKKNQAKRITIFVFFCLLFFRLAPNVYNIPSVLGTTKEGNKKTAPAYSISGRQRVFTDDRILVPGPGSYEAIKADAVRAKSPAYSISARYQLPDDHSKIPGPGAHCPEKVCDLIFIKCQDNRLLRR